MALREHERGTGAEEPKDGRCNGAITGTGPGYPDVEQRYCMNRPEHGRTRCKFHGGATPQGIDHWMIKQKRGAHPGRYSRHLPTNLAARYEDLVESADATSLRDEMALTRALLQDDLAGLSDGGGPMAWGTVRSLARKVLELADDLDASAADEFREVAREIAFVATEGIKDEDRHAKILTKVRALKDVADTENKRDYLREKAISLEEFALVMSVVLNTVDRLVDDREAVSGIFKEVNNILFNTGRLQKLQDPIEVVES